MTPFFANHGRYPRMGFWDAELALKWSEGVPTPQKRLKDEADIFAKQMNEVLTQLQAGCSAINQSSIRPL
jgi:hypothetical protein